MNFIDKATIVVAAGNGGDGRVSFRHEKFVDKGGPDGGDGGNGGDVVLEASRNQNTLVRFRHERELKSEPGQAGGKSRKHGKSGQDLIIPVPVGTVATTESGDILADLTDDGQRTVIALGGRGGFGNAHFVSSRRQAPKFAEKGEPGERLALTLELKMIADVGLAGLPNAGKSTLLSKISGARPEIADYPFTTLVPNLGVVDIDENTSLLFADIPGLIEGAAAGKGLGHEFLRHIERTKVIVHLIDAYQPDIAKAYQTIKQELRAHDPDLAKRAEIVAINKTEGLDQANIKELTAQLKKLVPKGTKIFAISAQSGQGLKELLFAIKGAAAKASAKTAEEQAEEPEAVPVLRLTDLSNQWRVEKSGDKFIVTGDRVEQFTRRTDFGSEEGVQRLRDIMRKMGIMHELVRQGVKPDQVIQVGKSGNIHY